MVTQTTISLNQPNGIHKGIVTVEPLHLSAEDSAKFLGISRSFFYNLHNSGQLGPLPVKLGKRVMWRLEELRAWANAGFPYRQEWQKHESFQSNIQN